MITYLPGLQRLLQKVLEDSRNKKTKEFDRFKELPGYIDVRWLSWRNHDIRSSFVNTNQHKSHVPLIGPHGNDFHLLGGQPLGFIDGWQAATDRPLYFVCISFKGNAVFLFFSEDPTEEADKRYPEALVTLVMAA
jgi:hypothetical protein